MNDYKEKLQTYFNSGDTEGAKCYLLELLEQPNTKNSYEINYKLGQLYFYDHDIIEAKKCFLKSQELFPEHLYSRFYLGRIFEEENEYVNAAKVYSSCCKTNPELTQLHEKNTNMCENLLLDNSDIASLVDFADNNFVARSNYPLISIIVLCYNKLEYTEKCLRTVFDKTFYENFEVIVVDNGSVDDTSAYLETWGSKIKFVHSHENLGFVGGNNFASESANGDYLVFLNNDTEVTENWLVQLYNTFVVHPNAGAAGSMLIYPDNSLQEAGGIIFNDGTGWNYGKEGSINDSRYNFLREVDYCSGAALMVRTELFYKHGKFDERFAPAYYEDTDLCFGVRKLGYKVYYNPLSKVVHHEGITSGTDLSKGFKSYQNVNKDKFIDKWENELKEQHAPNPNNIYQFSKRSKGKHVLIIDDVPPFPDQSSGALRHHNTLKQMLSLGYSVTYVYMLGKQFTDKKSKKHFDDFKMQGVEFQWFNYEGWWSIRNEPVVKDIHKDLIDSLELKKRKYDFIYIAFWHIADYFIDLIRNEVPKTPIVIDSVDVHYIRETRRAEILDDKKLLLEAEETKKNEIALYKKADTILTVTEQDREELIKDMPNKSVIVVSDVHDGCETTNPFNKRKDFLFVGNFNHNPNEDAVFFFIEEIFPKIKLKIPDSKFYIVGNNPTKKILEINSGDIVVTGWVPEIEPYLEQCLVTVVPLRFGAGMKGKVGQSLSHGLPMVSTVIGAEGMDIVNEKHAFIADDPEKFANYCIELYTNEDLWNRFSSEGKHLISSKFSSTEMRRRIKYIGNIKSREEFKSNEVVNYSSPPKVSIIILTYNQLEYTKECISSIYKNTFNHFELIVVDNNSTDQTQKYLKKLQLKHNNIRVIFNSENTGFPKGINQGILEAMGQYIVIANNDIVLTENWLEKMICAAESETNIGIVGPMSNSVSGVQLDKNAKYESIEKMYDYARKIAVDNKGSIEEFPRVAFLCTLIKREVIDKIGGLDERFTPGNFEDDDFCLRAQMAGYKTVITKDVFVHHYGSVSFKNNGNDKYAERLKINENKFIDKWGSNPEGIWLNGINPKSRTINISIDQDLFNKSVTRAFLNIDDEEYNLALENLKIAIENFNKSDRIGYENITQEELLNIAGNIALARNELETAKKYFEEELQRNPNSSNACFGLGEIFGMADMIEESKAMYEWAIANNPENQNAVLRLNEVNSKLQLASDHNSLLVQEEESS